MIHFLHKRYAYTHTLTLSEVSSAFFPERTAHEYLTKQPCLSDSHGTTF